MDNRRSDALKSELENQITELESLNLQLSFIRSGYSSCNGSRKALQDAIYHYNQLLERGMKYKDNSFLKSGEFERIKHRYILAGIRYWMFARELKKKCDYRPDIVLFFSKSLKHENCEKCSTVGQELSILKKKYDGGLLVFTIPTEMDDGIVTLLEQKYDIDSVPAMVINENKTLYGTYSRNEIEKYLGG